MASSEPVLCRMHSGSVLADTFSSTLDEGGRNLTEAIQAIEAEGRGIVVYLPPRGDLRAELKKLLMLAEEKSSPFTTHFATRAHGGTLLLD